MAADNTGYDATIRAVSGTDKSEAAFGDWFSYAKTPRARIFARDAGKVDSAAAMRALMRYNDPSDKLVKDAGHAISARWDLVPDVGYDCSGATDAKVASRYP